MDSGVRRAGAAAGGQKPLVSGRTGREPFRGEKKEAVPTESLHARWLAQDGSEPRSGAGARGGGVVAGGGGVGLEARRGGFVILWMEGESGRNHYPANQARHTDNLRANET